MKSLRRLFMQHHMVSDTNGHLGKHIVVRADEEKIHWIYRPSGELLTEHRYQRQLNLRLRDS